MSAFFAALARSHGLPNRHAPDRRLAGGGSAGLSFAFSRALWVSGRAEVYTLNAFLIGALFWSFCSGTRLVRQATCTWALASTR